jgi:hypothetical protein
VQQPCGAKDRADRNDIRTAAVGLLLVGAILFYQFWDFRTAFTDFDAWWEFFDPSFAGDDYIAATFDAEHVDNLHIYYRSIAVVTAARRMADGRPEMITAPDQLHLLWSLDPDNTGDFDNPGFRDTALETWSSYSLEWVDYDPVVEEETTERWRTDGRVEVVGWNVAMVRPDEPEARFVLLTDQARSIVYVVPLSLWGPGGSNG